MLNHEKHEATQKENDTSPGYRKRERERISAWRRFRFNLADLFKVKSIVTLGVIFVFCYMAIKAHEINNEFLIILTAIVTYYFCGKEKED